MSRRKRQPEGPTYDENGVPDLAQFTESPDFYLRLHEDALREGSFEKRVHASWGLIANGAAALPELSRMLRSKVADSREDAAGALAWIGDSRPDVIELLIESLRTATGHQERDAAIQALGDLRAKEALPVVASVVRDTSADGDTRHTAALALARIVKRRFDRDPDVVAAALAWIDQNPKRLNGAV